MKKSSQTVKKSLCDEDAHEQRIRTLVLSYFPVIRPGRTTTKVRVTIMKYICRKVEIPREEPIFVEARQFKNFNVNGFQKDLTQALRNFTFNSDPNIAWQEWRQLFLQICDAHVGLD